MVVLHVIESQEGLKPMESTSIEQNKEKDAATKSAKVDYDTGCSIVAQAALPLLAP